MIAPTGKRKHPRIPLALEIRSANNAKPFQFVSKNVSVGGVYIEGNLVFPIGLRVDVLIRLPYAHGEVNLQGEVVRHSQDPATGLVNGMGIAFSSLGASQEKALAEYIRNTACADPTAPDQTP